MGLIRFIVYGNVLISLSAAWLSFGLVSFLEINNPKYYFLCVFFATLFIYNFQRIPRLDEITDQYSDRHIWLSKNRNTLFVLTVFGGFGALTTYFGALTIQNDFLFLIIIGLIGVLYAVKALKGLALRDFPYVKIHLIALIWVLIIAMWPLIREQKPILNHLELIVALYFILVAITIPFDIRDLSYDDLKKRTIPQLIGVKWSKVIASIFLCTGFALLASSDNSFTVNPFYYISFLGFFVLIVYSKTERKETYFSGYIDGWILFLGLMFLLTSRF